MKTNYVLIDYENVQPEAIPTLDHEHFKLLVFVGATQTKIAFDIATAVQRMGTRAEYIKIAGQGPNALDFHIAYFIGKLASQEPDARFHIVSNDTGFDPLIQYLKSQKIVVTRSRSLADIPAIRAVSAKTSAERYAIILANLQQRGTSLPRSTKTLTSTIQAIFQKQLPEAEVTTLVRMLEQQGIVATSGTKLVYTLPT